ncbi:MAG: hypothetical protein IT577_13765 [Verrucomicrobiae bacterium]|nr:hypothetical protein [Verrucomicrobiae bacterium]
MDYPLGTFPRFGHQERWAHARRERAISNSIATRRWQAFHRRSPAQKDRMMAAFAQAAEAEQTRKTFIHLGRVALDWIEYISRINDTVTTEASAAAQLSAECAAIHREFELFTADFTRIPDAVGSPQWVVAVERLEERYGDLGSRIEALKPRVAEARIVPVRQLWLRFRTLFE